MATETNDQNITKAIAKGFFVVDVYADWCGPCRMLAPELDKLSKMGNDFQILKVNADSNKETTTSYKVQSLPTILFVKDGKEVGRHVGYSTAKALFAKITQLK